MNKKVKAVRKKCTICDKEITANNTVKTPYCPKCRNVMNGKVERWDFHSLTKIFKCYTIYNKQKGTRNTNRA